MHEPFSNCHSRDLKRHTRSQAQPKVQAFACSCCLGPLACASKDSAMGPHNPIIKLHLLSQAGLDGSVTVSIGWHTSSMPLATLQAWDQGAAISVGRLPASLAIRAIAFRSGSDNMWQLFL